MAKMKKLHYSTTFEDEQGLGFDIIGLVADAAGEAEDASLCPVCRDPLTWHEQACQPVMTAQTTEPAVADLTPAPRDGFAYPVGQVVQPTPEAPARAVVWRGQLKERHPATGLVQRVPVYRLDDGYWDCYREEELQAA